MHRQPPSAILPLVASTVLSFASVRAQAPAADELPPDHAQRMAKGLEMYDGSVRELLTKHCVACHGGEKTRGNLDLATREGLLLGGDSGKAIKPFRAAESLLVKLISHTEEPAMPDESPKLPDEAIQAIADWVDHGAPYSAPLVEGKRPPRDGSIVTDADRAWWSFQPLANVAPPAIEESIPGWNEIDRFIQAEAAKRGRKLAPMADKRKLIRRASFDLLGVPPSPESVAAFVMDDSPEAWSRVVDSLLADPRYGERQARRWLDVARFAESAGFEHDYDRPGAWAYRDFVIRAFNADMPYDQFVRWQLAGDELAPSDGQAMTATGFLGAGVFPTQITANEVERTRYDAMDDMLSTTSAAFLGLTVGCARCHDHKFDPIPTRDYYRMLSTFTTTVRSNVEVDLDPARTASMLVEWEAAHRPLVEEAARVEMAIRPEFDAWLAAGADPGPAPAWRVLELDSIASRANAAFQKFDDGSYLVSGANETQDEYTLVARSQSRSITGLKLDALTHPSMVNGGPGRAANGNFGLSRIRLFARPLDAEGKPQGEPVEVALVKPQVTFQQNDSSLSIAASLDEDQSSGWAVDPQIGKDHAAVFTLAQSLDHASGVELKIVLSFRVNAQHNLGRPRVSIVTDVPEPKLDGESMPAPVAEALAAAKASVATLSDAHKTTLYGWFRSRHPQWKEAQGKVDAHVLAKPKNTTNVLICGEGHPPMRHHTQGADFFNETHVLERGSTERKKEVAAQSFLQVLMRSPEAEKLWPAQPTSDGKASGRRAAMANWIVDLEHGAGPLAARTIVNRLWQWRLGTGLVSTPNDLGRTGAKPTHPELLDWLAGRLLAEKWKLKAIDRLIVSSATYRQGTLEDAPLVDAGELFVSRKPRRLDAEALRDAMLAVSGELDPTPFGPGTLDENSRRRSVYFTMKRSQLVGSMVVFDQPEPLVSQGSRPTTTVAPQALLVMNGPQVRRWAVAMAGRVAAQAPIGESFDSAVRRVFLTAVAREPSRDELADATTFLNQQAASYQSENRGDARQTALADFCQVVFGLNEFAYVE